MRRLVSSMTAVVMLAGCLWGISQSASAQPSSDVRCGATITTNTTLHHDLIDCANQGLVVGADNLTLDLNGHKIDGDDLLVKDCPAGTACDVGILNEGHRRLRIKGGSITDFGVGVLLNGTEDNSLRHLSIDNNYFDGVLVLTSTRLKIDRNSITRNGLEPHFAGMAMFGLSDAVVTNNHLDDNGDQGMFATNSSNRNRVVGNHFSGDTESGLAIDGTGNEVSSNRIVGGGIILIGDANRLAKNVILDPPSCDDGCGIGISFEGGSRNIIEANVVVRAPVRGIRIDAYVGSAVDNTLRKNIVRDTGIDGIAINLDDAGPVSGTMLDRNVVTNSGDDGIDVKSRDTTIRANLAVGNHDLGIEAVAGVTDGGGNKAFGNGNLLQCTHVRCSGRH